MSINGGQTKAKLGGVPTDLHWVADRWVQQEVCPVASTLEAGATVPRFASGSSRRLA
jgi:hypothetical protein